MQPAHPMRMLYAAMRPKLYVKRLAVICGMVSMLMASTMPTMRNVETMVMAMSAIMVYSTRLTGSRCERANSGSNAVLTIMR